MAKAERRAEVEWEGNLVQGNGKIVRTSSGSLGNLPISWSSRTESPNGKTSPEELMAAAQAACFAMALSHTLATEGKPAEKLFVDATCAFEPVGGGFKVTTMDISVRGKVPGMDEASFENAVNQAEQGCPVVNALRNNVHIRLQAHLEK